MVCAIFAASGVTIGGFRSASKVVGFVICPIATLCRKLERLPQSDVARVKPIGFDAVAVDDGIVGFLLFVSEPVRAVDLVTTLNSVRDQPLNNWEVAICVDAESAARTADLVADFADTRVSIHKVRLDTRNLTIADFFSSPKLRLIGFLEPGDRLANEALVAILGDLDETPSFLYTDSIVTKDSGQATHPGFAPDWSPEYLYRNNYITGLWLISCEVAATILPRLNLVHVDFRGVLARAALEDSNHPPVLHVRRPILLRAKGGESQQKEVLTTSPLAMDETVPKVSIIIPTRDRRDLLQRAIESVREKTLHSNYEIVVVDNASSDPAVLEYLNRLRLENIARLTEDGGDFNFSRLVNHGVAVATGEIIVLLNNDTYVIRPIGLANWPVLLSIPVMVLSEPNCFIPTGDFSTRALSSAWQVTLAISFVTAFRIIPTIGDNSAMFMKSRL